MDHIKVHEQTSYTCKICQKPFTTVRSMNRHVKTQHELKSAENIVKTSTGFFSVHEESTDHELLEENASKKMKNSFPCNQCNKELASKQRLESHLMAYHTKTNIHEENSIPEQNTIPEQKIPVGRPIGSSKDPSSLSEKTKQKYARKLTNDYKESLEKLSLKDKVVQGLLKDFEERKGISALTESDVIKMAQDKTISDATLQ